MERLLFWANSGLFGSMAALLGAALIAYPLSSHFSIPSQIVAHIAMLLFAFGIKISYITRLVALKELGRELY